MDEREIARAEVDRSRERVKDIAVQLAHRAQPTYVKQRAKEAAVHQSIEIKDKILGSPVALGILGGLATALVAKIVIGRRQDDEEPRRALAAGEFEPDEPDDPGRIEALKSRAADTIDDVKRAAGNLKDRAVAQGHRLGERIPSKDEVKARAHDARLRATEYANREPLVTALGAVAVGAALGLLIPLSETERRALGRARDQVSETVHTLASDVGDRVQQKVDELHDQIVGDPNRGSDIIS